MANENPNAVSSGHHVYHYHYHYRYHVQTKASDKRVGRFLRHLGAIVKRDEIRYAILRVSKSLERQTLLSLVFSRIFLSKSCLVIAIVIVIMITIIAISLLVNAW